MGDIFLSLMVFAFIILPMTGIWKVFSKVDIPAYLAFIPFVNLLYLCKVTNRKWYTGFLFLVPIVNLFFSFVVFLDIAKRYGRGVGFTIGMIFLPMLFFPLLGFMAEPVKDLDQLVESLGESNIKVA